MESRQVERKTVRVSDGVVKMDTLVEMPNEDQDENKLVKDGHLKAESLAGPQDPVVVKIPALDKYNLRTKSIQNRLETEKKRRNPRREPKPKQRPPPLSKYRRRTANARERTRMQEINDAFEELKRVVPNLPPSQEETLAGEKLTKITTLRLAVNYIAALTQILKQTEEPAPSGQCSNLVASSLEEKSVPNSNQVDTNNNVSTSSSSSVAANDSNQSNINNNDNTSNSNNVNPSAVIAGNISEHSLFDCTDLLETNDFVAAEIENLLRLHRPSSCSSSDLPSCSSPSTTTETDSLESLKSGCGTWDFTADDTLDVPDTFDLILESDESMQLSDDPLI